MPNKTVPNKTVPTRTVPNKTVPSRTVRYREICEALRTRLDAEEFAPGDLLPSEAELGAAHGASRVTVRKALELLRDDGLIDSRQGFGWFRATPPLSQTLTRLSTLDEQLAGGGLTAERRVVGFAFTPASVELAALFGVDQVLEVVRCNLADGQPFARVTVWCPADLAADLSRADVERSPFVELLQVDFGGATQTIGADAAAADAAEMLKIPVGSPVLRVRRVTHDRAGTPVLVSEHVFAAHRTEFVVELPFETATLAPAGLRLVESTRGDGSDQTRTV